MQKLPGKRERDGLSVKNAYYAYALDGVHIGRLLYQTRGTA